MNTEADGKERHQCEECSEAEFDSAEMFAKELGLLFLAGDQVAKQLVSMFGSLPHVFAAVVGNGSLMSWYKYTAEAGWELPVRSSRGGRFIYQSLETEG